MSRRPGRRWCRLGCKARVGVDFHRDPCLHPEANFFSSQGSAKLLGIDGEAGTLEAGKFADILAVPGDVLQDIRATERPLLVMKQGVVVRESSGERDAE